MAWLLITLSFYLIFSITSLIDKYLLTAAIPSPKVYAFYVGILGLPFIFILPFLNLPLPRPEQIVLALFTGGLTLYGLFWLYKALRNFEASRIIPAIGGLSPVLTMGIVCVLSKGKEILGLSDFLSFSLLVSASVLITYEGGKISWPALKVSFGASFFSALAIVLTKYVYISLSFWPGFVWTRIGGLVAVFFFFLFWPEVKKEVFALKKSLTAKLAKDANSLKENFKIRKNAGLFLFNQLLGGLGGLLQNFAIFLAPLSFTAIISALAGVQYAFLLILVFLLSSKQPQLIKEQIKVQKIIAVFLIAAGLVILTL